MAEIVGGVGTSHVPSIGAALDNGKIDEPPWRGIFSGYEPARSWIADKSPDIAIVIYNDHGSAFSLDMLPTFAVGAAPRYESADEGYGPRRIPEIVGDPDLSWHLIERLVADDFDPAICQRLPLDHGATVPLSILWGGPSEWPVQVVPIAVNVIQYPLPTAQRCLEFGRSIARAVADLERPSRVVVIGTGGMSHQLQGERAGHINREFDQRFLDDISPHPERLAAMSTVDYIRQAGSEGAELIMWLVMRGALGDEVKEMYRDYHVPASNTAAGIIVLEPAA